MGLTFTVGYCHSKTILGIPIILVISFVLFLNLRVLAKSDMRSLLDLLPHGIAKSLINRLNKCSMEKHENTV